MTFTRAIKHLIKKAAICGLREKRLILTLFPFVVVLALRQLTFLPFNPVVDTFFPETYNESNFPRVKAAEQDLLENNYPIVPLRTRSIAPFAGAKNHSKKLLLLWTDFFEKEDWELGMDISTGIHQLKRPICQVSNCYFTKDRSLLPNASAVLFHFRNLHAYDLPETRSLSQYWIFTLFESPDHTYSGHYVTSRTSKRLLATDYKGFFNWTMSYRIDSDIPLFYGHFKNSEDELSVKESVFSKKNRTAVTFMSLCDTPSHRLEYIREMQRYIDIDIIGACSDSQSSHLADSHCLSKDTPDECYKFVSATYKFYLAFENSLCGDYVTEKFFRAASLDLVPVVLNGALDISKFGPPQSYINAVDFASPKHLARYLEYVSHNEQLYTAHFWWKRFYEVDYIFNVERAFCDTCAKLAEVEQAPPGSYAKVYHDIDTWWSQGAGRCRPGIIPPNQNFRIVLERILFLLVVSLIILLATKVFSRNRNSHLL